MSDEFKNMILDTVADLVSDFMYYDRKHDEELNAQQLENAFEKKIITVEECVAKFEEELRRNV